MNTPLLDRISQPEDLKQLTDAQLAPLCEEIRAFLLESVAKTGGHLASNLGAIELTVALHRALHSPEDKLVFDVGHQCYTHKLLTGRRAGFDRLRMLDGLSGFPNPRESEHDSFIAGHGNTALSLAIGMARAKKLRHEPGQVVAIIGDGAFTGGMVYEGINNIDTLDNLVVVLNDNKMSISKNVGAMARYLTRLRTNPAYFRMKENVEGVLDSIPVVGKPVKDILQGGKRVLRRNLYHSTLFEEMGFQYVGPIDGHDVLYMSELFSNLRHQTAPLFVHVVTTKGKGYRPAERNPGEFHGVSSFTPDGMDPDRAPAESFSTVFGRKLAELGQQDSRLCAITAAMKYGTGLQFFSHACPERFFDVGMAEQHAVTFAAGLASQGLVPVVGIYSTFLQRSYDQLIHDVGLLQEPVILAVDRAGLVPGDGETHQGVYDPAFLSGVGIPTWSPANYAELELCLTRLTAAPDGPAALRYPRGAQSSRLAALGCTGEPFRCIARRQGAGAALVSYGSETEDILAAADRLEQAGIPCDCFQLLQIHPLPQGLCAALKPYPLLLFAEECIPAGGIGEHLLAAMQQTGWQGTYLHRGVDKEKLTHATVAQLKARMGLDGGSLAAAIEEKMK